MQPGGRVSLLLGPHSYPMVRMQAWCFLMNLHLKGLKPQGFLHKPSLGLPTCQAHAGLGDPEIGQMFLPSPPGV